MVLSGYTSFGDIMVLALPPPVDPDDVNTLNSKNIQPIAFKFYLWVDAPLRYFAAKRHLYPPNLQNAISP